MLPPEVPPNCLDVPAWLDRTLRALPDAGYIWVDGEWVLASWWPNDEAAFKYRVEKLNGAGPGSNFSPFP